MKKYKFIDEDTIQLVTNKEKISDALLFLDYKNQKLPIKHKILVVDDKPEYDKKTQKLVTKYVEKENYILETFKIENI